MGSNATTMDGELGILMLSRSLTLLIIIVPAISFLVSEWIRRSVGRKSPPAADSSATISGHCDQKFEAVRTAFQNNFERNWEKGGAAIAVFHKGQLVVDLWGGWADKESRKQWTRDTLNITFSSTKAVSALCIGVLVDRGHLSYDDPLVKFWPKFGKNGKEEITVQSVLSHTAGLAYLDEELTKEMAQSNPEAIAAIFEKQSPNWEPNSAVGYHALTYGWLIDQIVRRADPKNRSLGQFYREEILSALDGDEADYHIGLADNDVKRVARITLPSLRQRLSEFFHNPYAVYYWRYFQDFYTNGILSRVERTPKWLRFVFEVTLNNPELYSIEQGAVLGIGTARSLAAIFQKAIFERRFFKNPATYDEFLTPRITTPDIVTGAVVTRGNGLMFSKFRLEDQSVNENQMIGHAGYGGQNIKFDTENGLVFCYLSNALKGGFGDSARTFVSLRDAIYSSLNP